MKKIAFALLCVFSFLQKAHAVNPIYGTVQITTTTTMTPTLQNGAINIASGTIVGVRGSTITYSSATFTAASIPTIISSSGTITTFNSTTITASTANVTNFTATTSTMTNVTISSMTSTLPMSGRKITGLANATSSTDGAAFGQLVTVQKAAASFTASSATAATSFVPMNIVKVITPTSASNKVRITLSAFIDLGSVNIGNQCIYSIFKSSSTNLGNATQGFGYITNSQSSATADTGARATVIYEDSPATTSTIWYGMYMSDGGVSAGTGTCTLSPSSQPNQIILEEVTP